MKNWRERTPEDAQIGNDDWDQITSTKKGEYPKNIREIIKYAFYVLILLFIIIQFFEIAHLKSIIPKYIDKKSEMVQADYQDRINEIRQDQIRLKSQIKKIEENQKRINQKINRIQNKNNFKSFFRNE